MELRHLRYFVALAEELHFARAAERLNIAPPTLTVQIQEIERTLSARLFVRTKRSVALTAAGKVFLDEARNVLETYDRAESIGRRAGRNRTGRDRLCGQRCLCGCAPGPDELLSEGLDMRRRQL